MIELFSLGAEPEVTKIYQNVEQKSRLIVKLFIIFCIFNETTMSMPALFQFVYGVLNGDRDMSNYKLQWKFPIEPNNCMQWLLLWCTALSYGISYCGSTLTITAYFVGSCYYLMAICEQFKHLIQSIDKDVEFYQMQKNPHKYQAILRKIKLKLCKSIDVHSNIFE